MLSEEYDESVDELPPSITDDKIEEDSEKDVLIKSIHKSAREKNYYEILLSRRIRHHMGYKRAKTVPYEDVCFLLYVIAYRLISFKFESFLTYTFDESNGGGRLIL